MTVLLWLGLSWLSVYPMSGITSVTRRAAQPFKPLTPRFEADCPTAEPTPSDPSDCVRPSPISHLNRANSALAVSTPMQGALGIEYPGITGINLAVYDPKATISGLPAPVILESTVAHEVGHQ